MKYKIVLFLGLLLALMGTGTSATYVCDFDSSLSDCGLGSWSSADTKGNITFSTSDAYSGDGALYLHEVDTSHNSNSETGVELDLDANGMTNVQSVTVWMHTKGTMPTTSNWAWTSSGYFLTDETYTIGESVTGETGYAYCGTSMNEHDDNSGTWYTGHAECGKRNYSTTATGNDGATWYKYSEAIPSGWNNDSIRIQAMIDSDGGDGGIQSETWAWFDYIVIEANTGSSEKEWCEDTDEDGVGNSGSKVMSVTDPGPDWYSCPGTYTNWASNEPNDSNGEDCTEIYSGGAWNDLGCGTSQPALCEISGHYETTTSMTWTSARDECETRGGHLAIINNAEENTYIDNNYGNLWIGFNDRNKEGVWDWAAAENWYGPGEGGNEPNDANGAEEVAHLRSGSYWNDNTESNSYAGLCEFSDGTYQTTSSMSWGNAKQECYSRGGFLAVIDSGSEASNLESNYGSVWIGYTDSGSEANWRWINQPPFTPSSLSSDTSSYDSTGDVTLSGTYSDPEVLSGSLKFYKSDDTFIGSCSTNSDTSCSVTWNNVACGTKYWYATSDDGRMTTQSSTQSFTVSCSILESQSNTAAPAGAVWIEGSDLHWADGSTEYWLKDAEIVSSSSPGPKGAAWIEGSYLHWIDQNDDERRYQGPVADSSPGGSIGAAWIEGGYIHYIDANGDERVADGT